MTKPRLIGTIVEKDGMLCLQTAGRCWYPLNGSSGIASDFCDAFGSAKTIDIGKRLYWVGDVLQMENAEQVAAREG